MMNNQKSKGMFFHKSRTESINVIPRYEEQKSTGGLSVGALYTWDSMGADSPLRRTSGDPKARKTVAGESLYDFKYYHKKRQRGIIHGLSCKRNWDRSIANTASKSKGQ